ncbi:MAG: capsule biosynthesis protein [Rhodobacteraceae bacterium]|nr:capsule biosynthesis protein [Paracoccaceae bacterium]
MSTPKQVGPAASNLTTPQANAPAVQSVPNAPVPTGLAPVTGAAAPENAPVQVKPTPPAKPVGDPEALEEIKVPPASKAKIRRPAGWAQSRPRHRFLVMSFFLLAIGPMLVLAGYLWWRAADQYASYVGFSVRNEQTSSAIELLGGITSIGSSGSADADILYSFLKSQELVDRVDQSVDLREAWSAGLTSHDPFFTFDPSGTLEDLVAHWTDKVTIVYDSGTGLIDLRILAFDPETAQAIAEEILAESTTMINDLSDIAREDAVTYSREELETAVERLKVARQSLTEFRNRTQIVDPSIDTQNQMGLLVTLQQQQAEALIELDLLRETSRANDPRVAQTQRRVNVIENRIEEERQKLGIGTAATENDGEAFASLVGEYESLIVDREFAEAAYTTALASFDAAQAEARRQSRYLAAHVRPTLAQKPEYPERMKIFALSSLFILFFWATMALLYYSLRDRR